jgi:predicted CoA-binding protein
MFCLLPTGGNMATQAASLDTIQDFLAQKRIALVGISREPASDSARLFEELRRRGYDMVPVNPNTTEVQGQRCFARVQHIQPPVEAALLMTTPEVTETVAHDCAEAGIRRLWMYRGIGTGSVSPKAVAFCEEQGMQVVPGQCPYMFLPQAAGVHRFHGFVRKITGRYPRHARSSEQKCP